MKICEFCKEEITGNGKRFCSKSCATKSKNSERWKDGLKRAACLICGTKCKRADTKYCSKECYIESRKGKPGSNKGIKQSKETIAKRIENTDQSKKEAKRKQTMIDRYGEDNPTKLAEVKEKLSRAGKGRKCPRVEGQQEKIIESKKRNGTLKHSEETKKKISKILREVFSDPNFDKSVFIKETYNKNSKTGYHNGIYFRSSYEEMFLKFCERYQIKVESAATKEHSIKYLSNDGTIRTYFPDFYLPEQNTTVEIKPVSMMEVGDNINKIIAAAGEICNYVVLTEIDGFLYEEEWDEFYNCQVKFWS